MFSEQTRSEILVKNLKNSKGLIGKAMKLEELYENSNDEYWVTRPKVIWQQGKIIFKYPRRQGLFYRLCEIWDKVAAEEKLKYN